MVFEKLSGLIAEHFGVDADKISMDTHFIDDLNADSIDVVDLMMEVESLFNLDEINEDDLQNVRTVGDVVGLISDRI
ncbi:MAG: acyl carrier protein [Clostridia bacterium]|nr:acyl carrier protein [Clostridia bacterium]MBQ9924493.1 acyl carrier protein [Clostridia bacterium]